MKDRPPVASTTLPPGAAASFSEPTATDAMVEAWFVETFHNLGLPGELFNRFRRAADDLKARLRAKE